MMKVCIVEEYFKNICCSSSNRNATYHGWTTKYLLNKTVKIDERKTFEVESEVVLTSWDSLPKDFNVADLEQSDYEELKNIKDIVINNTIIDKMYKKCI